jgi:hypothetical protein
VKVSLNHVIYALASAVVLSYVQHNHPDLAAAAMQFLLVLAHALHVQPNGTTNGNGTH